MTPTIFDLVQVPQGIGTVRAVFGRDFLSPVQRERFGDLKGPYLKVDLINGGTVIAHHSEATVLTGPT